MYFNIPESSPPSYDVFDPQAQWSYSIQIRMLPPDDPSGEGLDDEQRGFTTAQLHMVS